MFFGYIYSFLTWYLKLRFGYARIIKDISILSFLYSALVILIYTSCLYLPMIYIAAWKKASAYKGDPLWSTFTKLYVILSASSSNFAYIFMGGGTV